MIILEDSDHARNVIKFFLEKNQFKVLGFKNGREALNHIKGDEVHDLKIIFTDIMMPEVDGFEFLRRVKEANKFQGVPILITSAMTDKDSILQAKNLGVSGYLLKPISIKKLTEALKKIFPNETFIDVSVK